MSGILAVVVIGLAIVVGMVAFVAIIKAVQAANVSIWWHLSPRKRLGPLSPELLKVAYISPAVMCGFFPSATLGLVLLAVSGICALISWPLASFCALIFKGLTAIFVFMVVAGMWYGWLQQRNPTAVPLGKLLSGSPHPLHHGAAIEIIQQMLSDTPSSDLRPHLYCWRARHQLAELKHYWMTGEQLTAATARETKRISETGAAEVTRQIELIRADLDAAGQDAACSAQCAAARKLLAMWERNLNRATHPTSNMKSAVIAYTIAALAIGGLIAFIIALIVKG